MSKATVFGPASCFRNSAISREPPTCAFQQPFDEPYLHLRVERTKAQELGFSARDIAQNLLVSLSGSFQTTPTFWVDPKTGVSYNIATQTPQYRADSLQDLVNTPVTGTSGTPPPSLIASQMSVKRGTDMAVVSHYNIAPTIDIFGATSGRDLGGVVRDMNKLIDEARSRLPRGSEVIIRGQVETMRTSYVSLLSGLGFAIILVYLLIVVNFQSWLDPFIMISALPAALTGIAWFLFVTHTTLSVPALMGTIMCVGVSTSNSILVVSFATEQMDERKTSVQAALEAGFTRFRPVLMTALAMIIGMVPMALGLGDGGEQTPRSEGPSLVAFFSRRRPHSFLFPHFSACCSRIGVRQTRRLDYHRQATQAHEHVSNAGHDPWRSASNTSCESREDCAPP